MRFFLADLGSILAACLELLQRAICLHYLCAVGRIDVINDVLTLQDLIITIRTYIADILAIPGLHILLLKLLPRPVYAEVHWLNRFHTVLLILILLLIIIAVSHRLTLHILNFLEKRKFYLVSSEYPHISKDSHSNKEFAMI